MNINFVGTRDPLSYPLHQPLVVCAVHSTADIEHHLYGEAQERIAAPFPNRRMFLRVDGQPLNRAVRSTLREHDEAILRAQTAGYLLVAAASLPSHYENWWLGPFHHQTLGSVDLRALHYILEARSRMLEMHDIIRQKFWTERLKTNVFLVHAEDVACEVNRDRIFLLSVKELGNFEFQINYSLHHRLIEEPYAFGFQIAADSTSRNHHQLIQALMHNLHDTVKEEQNA